MYLNAIFASLAILSLGLLLWQWLVARKFPLHQRAGENPFPPAVTLLKPLKGCDEATEDCLKSWFSQDYTGRVQILLGIDSSDDPVGEVVNELLRQFPQCDGRLVVCEGKVGANAKVAKLVELEKLASHPILVISDADVQVPADFLSNTVVPLRKPEVGLVNCFYELWHPANLAMRLEAVAINADFWSQVLQAQSLKPIDFALGAVMIVRREQLQEIGGFKALVDCLADDYQLGHRIAQRGHAIAISPVVVECRSAPMNALTVWKHQLRWARTIRVCQPLPYFFSILSNATLWPLLWLAVWQGSASLAVFALSLVLRVWAGLDLQQRLTRSRGHFQYWWLAPVKDLLQAVVWLLAFVGNRVEWRGQRMRLRRDGTLIREA
jgi:ceramide glucosyltransferase